MGQKAGSFYIRKPLYRVKNKEQGNKYRAGLAIGDWRVIVCFWSNRIYRDRSFLSFGLLMYPRQERLYLGPRNFSSAPSPFGHTLDQEV